MIRFLLVRLLRGLGLAVYYLGLSRIIMWLNRETPRVLLYHACAPEEDALIAGLGANTTPDVFARHMAFLARYYRVIPLATLEAGNVPPYACVITFDDGYRSVLENAYPVLRAHGFPATIYVVTGATDTGRLVWVNELNGYLRTRGDVARPLAARQLGLSADQPPEAFITAAWLKYDAVLIEALLEAIRNEAGPLNSPTRSYYIGWDDARSMRRDNINFGNHTATHPNLACLSPDQQRTELLNSWRALADHLEPPTSLAYPFGSKSRESAAVALETGHRSAMEVGGTNRPLILSSVGRVPVESRTDAGFFAELEVVGPLRGWLRRQLGR